MTLDDVWEAQLAFTAGAGAGGVEVKGWKCWQGAADSVWHESSGESDDDDEGEP